ncbi:MAG: T9SS type A sorting domain-containing protein [Bacteroidetes bacterium]|nr:T9SS type A sorting domain-containing protein [Bacteroidota bacterium]
MKKDFTISKLIFLCFIIFFIINTGFTVKAQSWQTVFFDNFNRADSLLGTNYNTYASGSITQSGIYNNEVKVASGTSSPSYWIVNYMNDINYDTIRVSCKFRSSNANFSFSLSARDNGLTSYRGGLIAMTDTIGIYLSDNIGTLTKLAGTKANFSSSKTYFIQLTLKHSNLSYRFVEVGQTDTIFLYATNDSLHGKKVSLSGYYYGPNTTNYFDDFRIEAYAKSLGIKDITSNEFKVYPNPATDYIIMNIKDLNTTSVNLNIYNMMGKLLSSKFIKTDQQQIDVSDLSNGIYIIEIKSKNGYAKQKLIIQR